MVSSYILNNSIAPEGVVLNTHAQKSRRHSHFQCNSTCFDVYFNVRNPKPNEVLSRNAILYTFGNAIQCEVFLMIVSEHLQ